MNCKKTVFLFLLLVCMAGCSDDDSPTSVNNAPIEPLFFVIYANPIRGGDAIRFEFSMEISDELPAVVANGKTIEVFYFQGAGINGYLDLPMAASIDFSVTSGVNSISGTIDMPTRVDEVSCNGVVLQEEIGNVLDATDSYQFEWTGGEADYFVCFFQLWDSNSGGVSFWDETLTNSWSAVEETARPTRFEVIAVNGSGLGPGASPNFTSTWANGYVNALAVPNSFWFAENAAQQPVGKVLSTRTHLMDLIQSR